VELNRHIMESRFLPFSLLSGKMYNTVVSVYCAGVFKQYIGAGNRVGIWLSYRPARLHRLAKLIPRYQYLGSCNYCIQIIGTGFADQF
jgi:hypothetical protein